MTHNLENLQALEQLIFGCGIKQNDGTITTLIRGMKNEEGVTEEHKRVLIKVSKKIREEIVILEQLLKDAGDNKEKQDEIKTILVEIEASDEFLFNDIKHLSFKNDYSYLYQSLCKDYLV